MKTQSKVVCFVGPSGVGKTSFAKRLVEKHKFALPTVVTTRRRRSDDDARYLYVGESAFLEMVNSGSFLEWDKYSDYYYGTLLRSFEELTNVGCCHNVVLDLTPAGCRKALEKIPTAILVALLPDDFSWLPQRLASRNSQSLEEIQARTSYLRNYLDEMDRLSCKRVYVSFSPDSWDKTFEEIEKIIFESNTARG